MRERWRQWLEETHGPFFELVRHFFHRMFESELITTPDQLRTWVVGVLAAILSFTLYIPLSQFRKYVELTMAGNAAQYHAHAMSDRLLFIIFPMLLVSFVAALEWQSLFPTERDYRNLMPLPVSRMQMFLAKLTAMTLFVLLFVGAVNLFPAFELPMVQMSSLTLEPFHIKHILGHLCAAAAGSLFAFLSLVALQGLLMNVLGRRLFPRVSLAVQSVLLLALLTALPHVLTVSTLYRRGGIPHEVMMWAPPFWFHGMYETFIGPLTLADKDALWRDSRKFAQLFGIPESTWPADWTAFRAYFDGMISSDKLTIGAASQRMTRFLLTAPNPTVAPLWKWYSAITAGLLPERLRRDLGFRWGRTEQLVQRTSMATLKLAWRRVPDRLRWLPAYVDARRRLRGEGRDGFGKLAERLVLGALRQARPAS